MRKAGRKSMIGGLLALSLILTGTGYAYWTDTLNVTTKATTGSLDVTFVDLGLYAQYDNETYEGGWSIVDGVGENGYVADDFFMREKDNYNIIAKDGSIDQYQENTKGYHNLTFDAELVDKEAIRKDVGEYTVANTEGSDRIAIEVLNMYPGYAQAFRSDILNVGEIAAKLSNLKFGITEDELGLTDEAKNLLGIAVLINHEQYIPDGGPTGKNVFKLCSEFGDGDNYFTVGEVDFLRLSALENLSDAEVKEVIENAQVMCSPDTDNRLDLFLGVAMDPDAEGKYTTGTSAIAADSENDDTASQFKGAVITIDFEWDQFNVGKDAGNPNYLDKQDVGN